MSMQRGCKFFETKDGNWYLALEDGYDRGRWDVYGPFETEDAAHDYLQNFSNPGGYMIRRDATIEDVQAFGTIKEPQVRKNWWEI